MDAAIAHVAVGGVGALDFVTQTPSDACISQALLRGEEWEPFESLLFRRLVQPGSLVCEVGANLGWYSVIAAKLGASVFAFESDPEIFSLMQRNLALNACTGVTAKCLALSDDAPRRLDDLIDGRRVDVLKVDAQGAELAIVRGAPRVLATGAPAILIELWPAGLRSAGADSGNLLSVLSSSTREIFELDPVERCLLRTSKAELLERTRGGQFSADGGDHLDLLLVAPGVIERVGAFVRERTPGRPLVELLGREQRRRVELTVACDDTSVIPKVAAAGSVYASSGGDVQVMHNGVKVVAGGYYGAWMSEVILRLLGHHEPQEELAYHEILRQLMRESVPAGQPTIVELGAFWSYYALWFLHSFPHGKAVLVEPDPSHLEVLRANLLLNDAHATVIQAAIGAPASDVTFECEDGTSVLVERLALAEVLDRASIERADVVVCDIQGCETQMLEDACAVLARRVRFLVLSTHHQSISGRWDTHDRCLSIIHQSGGHVIAEHTVEESFSGDGLIAASFDPRDSGLQVVITRARSGSALFRGSDELHRHSENLERSLRSATEYAQALETRLGGLEAELRNGSTHGATSIRQLVRRRIRREGR